MFYFILNIYIFILLSFLHILMSAPQVLSWRINPSCPYDVCDNSFNYPEEKVARALEENELYREVSSYFGTVTTPIFEYGSAMINSTEGKKNIDVCRGKMLITYPKSIISVKLANYTIIQTNETRQAVKFYTCESNEKCDGVTEGSYNTQCCIQKFINIPLIVFVDENNKNNIFQTFKVPSACACSYQAKYF